MSEKNAWALFISFPKTLDELYACIEIDDALFFELDEELLEYYMNCFPRDARVGDYVFFVVTDGNVKVIDRLTEELKTFPKEWRPKQYRTMLDVLEYAREKYIIHDGRVFYKATVEKVVYEDNEPILYLNSGICYDENRPIKKYQTNLFKEFHFVKGLSDWELYELNRTIKDAHLHEEFNLSESRFENAQVIEYGDNVQAFVTNNTFNKSLDEVLADMQSRGFLTLDCLFHDNETSWTAPKWCKAGDIAFFMFAKTANAAISRLETEFKKTGNRYSLRERRLISDAIQHGRALYKQYGGSIFAFARVTGSSELEKNNPDSYNHWRSRIYAPMDQVTILDNPISIEEFRSFLTISRQNTITPVLGDAFEKMKHLIISKNEVPAFFRDLHATPFPLKDINETNWIDYGKEYRRHFFLEEAFRRYYVDYLLKELGDKKTFYRECGCYKAGGNPPRVDNIIVLFGKYLPVEVKLNINNERNLAGQVSQYCRVSFIHLGNEKILKNLQAEVYEDNVLIIDTESVYMFDNVKNTIYKIYSLDSLTAPADVASLRNSIKSYLI